MSILPADPQNPDDAKMPPLVSVLDSHDGRSDQPTIAEPAESNPITFECFSNVEEISKLIESSRQENAGPGQNKSNFDFFNKQKVPALPKRLRPGLHYNQQLPDTAAAANKKNFTIQFSAQKKPKVSSDGTLESAGKAIPDRPPNPEQSAERAETDPHTPTGQATNSSVLLKETLDSEFGRQKKEVDALKAELTKPSVKSVETPFDDVESKEVEDYILNFDLPKVPKPQSNAPSTKVGNFKLTFSANSME